MEQIFAADEVSTFCNEEELSETLRLSDCIELAVLDQTPTNGFPFTRKKDILDASLHAFMGAY